MNSNSFKAGDKVRRIGNSFEEVVKGGVYTVREAAGDYIWFQGLGNTYASEFFELVATTIFQPGDRVAVAFESTIVSIVGDNAYFKEGINTLAVPLSSLTKLTEPLPTANGAVIRINDEGTIYEHNGFGRWFIPGDDAAYTTEPQAQADRYGFTVLYAGGE